MRDCQSTVSITESVSEIRSSVQEMLAHLKRGVDQSPGGQNGAAREKGFINSNPLKTKGRWVSFRELRRPNWMNFRNFLDDLKNNFFGVKMTPPDKFTKFI